SKSAQNELTRGLHSMLGRSINAARSLPSENAIILGTLAELLAQNIPLRDPPALDKDGYLLTHATVAGRNCLVIAGRSDRGVLYGVFDLLSKIARLEDIRALNEVQQSYVPLRWVNQWDNLDGHIERGYAGPSIFFADGKVQDDLTRAGQYARLL